MNIFKYLTDIVFPPRCLFCGEYMPAGVRPLVCEKCHKKADAFKGNCCRCHTDFVYLDGLPCCNTCKSARHPFDGVVSAYFYSGGVRRAVVEHKFNFNFNNSKTLSVHLSEVLLTLFSKNTPDFIIPVPTSRERLWERGYDPLLEIAEEISDVTTIPLLENVLIKHKNVPQQSMVSSVRQRLRNVRGCFSLKDKTALKGKTVVLLDDVYTTGATSRECAKVLKRNGCKYVFIATVAISESFRR